MRPTFVVAQHVQLAPASQRHFSSSESPKIQKFFEKKETAVYLQAWSHSMFPHYDSYAKQLNELS